jgi:hypothetical protein
MLGTIVDNQTRTKMATAVWSSFCSAIVTVRIAFWSPLRISSSHL